MTQKLVSTREAAALKGVTVKTINQWASSGRLPVAYTEQLSKARFFDLDTLTAFSPRTPAPVSPEATGAGVS